MNKKNLNEQKIGIFCGGVVTTLIILIIAQSFGLIL